MKCPGCGRESEAGAVFCTYCGHKIDVVVVDVKGGAISKEREDLKRAISSSDRHGQTVPPLIIMVPIVALAITYAIVLAASFGEVFDHDILAGDIPTQEELLAELDWAIVVSMGGSAFFYAFFAALTFVTIYAYNRHLDREQRIIDAGERFSDRASAIASGDSGPSRGDPSLTMPSIQTNAPKRNPVLWSLIVLMPIFGTMAQNLAALVEDFDLYSQLRGPVILLQLTHGLLMMYMLHLLTQDIWNHDVEWTNSSTRIAVSLGMAGTMSRELWTGVYMERRSPGLYIIATIVTAGLFMIYWWYAVLKDRNAHYSKQAMFEQQVLEALSKGA